MQDTAQLVAIILIVSFGVERIVAAASFWLEPLADDDVVKGERRRRILLAALGGALALAAVDFGQLRIVSRLQSGYAVGWLDFMLTWLVVFAGSDRLKDLFSGIGGGGAKAPKPPSQPPIKIELSDGLIVRQG